MFSEEELRQTFELETADKDLIALTFTNFLPETDSSRQANLVVESTESVFNKHPNVRYNLLIDLTPIEILPSFITKESREIYERFSENNQIRKVAIVGANLFYKIATNFLMKASRRGDIKWFTNKQEALKWFDIS